MSSSHAPTDTAAKPKTPAPVIAALTVASVIGVGVLMMLVTLGIRIVHDHGVLPTPALPQHYNCTSGGKAFVLEYLHGSDRIRAQLLSGEEVTGESFPNHIEWRNAQALPEGMGALLPVAFRYESAGGMEMATADQQIVACTLKLPS